MTIEISQENRQKLSLITSGCFYNKNTHFFSGDSLTHSYRADWRKLGEEISLRWNHQFSCHSVVFLIYSQPELVYLL